MRRALAWAILLLASAHSSYGQTPRSQPARDAVVHSGTAVIKGRIVEAGSGQPVRNVRVHAASPAIRDGRTGYTDVNGAFELTALPAGRYTVTAGKVGFVPAAHGQPRPMELGTAIDVADGQIVAAIDFTMSRAGVIAGAVTDEFGEPLANANVSAMRYQTANGVRRLFPASTRMTNDIGEFRLFNLVPGQYYLTATYRSDQFGREANQTQDLVYAPTYYPGTPNVSGAQALTIGSGQSLNGMNLMLLPVHPVRVSGFVSNSSGQAVRGAFVQATARDGFRGTMAGAPVLPDGTFVLNGLSAGEYVLHVRTGMDTANVESAAVPLSVGNGDVTDVSIVTSPPTTVTGRVHVDPAELGTLKGSTFRLSTPPSTPADVGIAGGATAIVKDDFTFELKIPPGHVFIRSNTANWFLRSVRVNGTEILDTGVEIRPNTAITGVEIELTHRQPEVTGTVRTAAGDPTRTAYVILFPQDRGHWGYLSRYVRLGRPNPDNQYRVLVPPGEYFAVALDYVAPGEEISAPEFLEPLVERGVPISLQDGDHKTLDLNLVPSPPR